MTTKTKKETPLMKQYFAIKAKYPGALLLFRVGDFYETFGEDAIKTSKILNITLTKRANGAASHVELAGFPHHALDNYMPKRVRAGNRVAICDQLEDPRQVKGIVKRGVTELVTPGLSFSDQILNAGKNNFLAAVHNEQEKFGVSLLDISTGEFLVAEGDEAYMEKLIQGFRPKEIIKSKSGQWTHRDEISENILEDWIFQYDFANEKLLGQFNSKNLKGFGIEQLKLAIVAAGGILHYLEITEHKQIGHIKSISRIEEENYVWLDQFTIRNLELIVPNHSDGRALIDILDECRTSMGRRLLNKWMVLPLKSKEKIEKRLNIVETFVSDPDLLEKVDNKLKHILDIERLIAKVAAGRINPREVNALRDSLEQIGPLKEEISLSIPEFANALDDCQELVSHVSKQLKPDAPMLISQGNFIGDGVDKQLDEYRSLAYSGKDHLVKIVEKETDQTGISSLKIAYNKVFGYYLEVTNAHKDKVPEGWIRKQTLVNAERYVTEELKQYEEKILKAENEISIIEQRIYQELIGFLTQFIPMIQLNAQLIAQLDCLVNFARLACANNYSKPSISPDLIIDIKSGRHPVIEQNLPMDTEYIPNDVWLDSSSQQILIITGPNMAGKSALLRQTALIVLMAQIGSYVPAQEARIGVVDKVFTRVGASDNLTKGESTFMVEMTETASIMNNLSDRSLVLMDEIGRGTSTYDGISIAWSLIEFLHNNGKSRPKTLFATHYHELNELENKLPRVKNYHVAIKELENKIVFLRKLIEGGTEHSFGIHVANMAGMPNEVVLRASEVLKKLEKNKEDSDGHKDLSSLSTQEFQLNLFTSDPKTERILKLLNQIDINSISPVEALLKLNEIIDILKS